jgi:polyphenol oxidase
MNWLKPDWPLPLHIHAAVTLREGGVSQGGYASLNPADHVGDAPEAVAGNRRIICKQLNLPNEPVWLQQVHGIHVARADAPDGLPADASVARQAGTVCAVLTADCLPVLLCGDHGAVIGAAHAGWRGLHAGVIQQTVAAMQASHYSVWLGPAIGAQRFEVGAEVREAFLQLGRNRAAAFVATAGGKWLADIYQLARLQLAELDISAIYGGEYCTVSDAARFYSYRRDGAITGRMASLIWSEA